MRSERNNLEATARSLGTQLKPSMRFAEIRKLIGEERFKRPDGLPLYPQPARGPFHGLAARMMELQSKSEKA